jgi:5-methylcytosine-specific restriction endonuclease McrA
MVDKQKHAAYMREYYHTHNKAKTIARVAAYNRQNKDRYRFWRNNYQRRNRFRLITLLGAKCIVCGSTDNLQIDHILAGGNAERIIRGSNHAMYRYYLGNPEEAKQKLQLLCKSHNLIKEFANHERW